MKRVTFVFLGLLAITTTIVLSQEKIEDKSIEVVKLDTSKHYNKRFID